MSKFVVTFEDETLEGLQHQIVGYLAQFNGFAMMYKPNQEVNQDDKGGENPLAGEPAK